ncbi:6233_t:CDS:2 [Entrophospora sp. SA101]|nr:6233_t:CDS:2 [Entrophospora sp. SA101]
MSLVNDNNSIILINDREEIISNFSSEESIANDRPPNRKKYTKHGRPRGSYIWDHFIEEGDERICQVKVPLSLEHPNGLCGKRLPNVSSTKSEGQTDIRDLIQKKRALSKKEQDKINQDLINFIVDDIQPFNILENKFFRHFVSSLNPNYEIPSQPKVDQLIEFAYHNTNQKLTKLIDSADVEYVSLTCDFWTSRGHHGYIGVTCSFLSEDFEFNKILLALQHVPYPHTAETINNKLQDVIFKWNLKNKVFTLTTDNGANMVKAARLLNYDLNIIRIPCFAHTLQLVVNKALKINTNIQSFVLRCKRLINFFTTPKQKENLEKMQKELSYPNIHTVIQDISTRWNSSFYSWRRLIDLQSAVTHLPSKLMADLNKDNKKDGKRLE